MATSEMTQITTSVGENNPKAVFIGGLHEIINPLALYLSANNVDLFSGNTFSDAFFGDYFFYVGSGEEVKKFLADNSASLPKSLMLLVDDSALEEIQEIAHKHSHIKLVQVTAGEELAEKDAEKIIEFFFAGQQTVLNLRQPGKKKQIFEPIAGPSFITEAVTDEPTSTKETPALSPQQLMQTEEVVPVPPEEKAQPVEAEITKEIRAESPFQEEEISAEPAKNEAVPQERKIPQAHKNISAGFTQTQENESQVRRQVESFYDKDADPKGSGRSPKTTPKRGRAPLVLAALVGLIIFVLFPIGAFATQLGLASLYAVRAKDAFAEFDLAQSEKEFSSAAFFSRNAGKSLGMIESLFGIVGQKALYTQLRQLTVVEEKLSLGGVYLAKAGQDGKTLLRGISGQDRGVAYGQLITAAKGNLTLADTEFAAAQAELKTSGSQTAIDMPFVGNKLQKLPEFIANAREKITTARSVLALAPEVIGLYGEQTYLVLFQNNMELRPTGGFIGSFGLLTLSDGAFKDFKVEDVYSADGALKGHIDPPPAISTHLGQEHWYLRDSNWDPDFSRSAARAMWFLDKELGVTVDGVIAVDLGLVQNVMNVTGPLQIEDYDEKITADNLFLKSHAFIQADFFPGSTQKRDFLGAIGRQLLSAILSSPAEKQPALLSSVHDSFLQKHALVYFVSPNAQQVAQSLNWTGEILPTECQQAGCVSDHSMVVDANLAVNKSNFFIKRSIEDMVTIQEDGTVLHTLNIKYRNESKPDDTKIGGYYKNYLRLIVPETAELKSAAVNTEPLELTTDSVASASSVITEQIASFNAFATFVEVEPQTEKMVSFTYELPAASDEVTDYSLTVRKQPGTTSDTYKATITYPADFRLVENKGKGSGEVAGATTLVNNHKITYNSSLLTDQLITAEFTKQ